MDNHIDNGILRNSELPALANYFNRTLSSLDTKQISNHLVAGLASGSIPPSVFLVWLSVRQEDSPIRIVDALRQEHSVSARRLAILRFGKCLRKANWHHVWSAAGGVQGLLEVFAKMSVVDVAHFCKAIGRCAYAQKGRSERQTQITILLKALCHDFYPDSKYRNPDLRPLRRHYATIVPACSANMVDDWMSRPELPICDTRMAHMAHLPHFRAKTLEVIIRGKPAKTSITLGALLVDIPGVPVNSGLLSGSMEFCLEILRGMDSNGRPDSMKGFEKDIALPLLRRMLRRRTSVSSKAEALDLIVRLLQAEDSGGETRNLSLDDGGIVYFATRSWSHNPEYFEQLLISLFQLVPTTRQQSLFQFIKLLRGVLRHQRQRLLELFLRYSNSFRMGIHNEADLEKDGFQWPLELFLCIPTTDALQLSQRIMRARPNDNIWQLHTIDHSSLFRLIYSPLTSTADIEVLLTYLRRGETTALEEAQGLVQQRKKSSASSRDQGERMWLAQSAHHISIASGSLALYQKTLLWARRFNRDPLTVKELYGRAMLHCTELLALLGAVVAPVATATELESRVRLANDVLLDLLETACTALREPSFYEPDWRPVLALFSLVVKERLRHANKAQRKLQLQEDEIYKHIWQPTVEMLLDAEKIGLQDGHEQLRFNTLGGPLQDSYLGGLPAVTNGKSAVCHFLDELAKARNDLWKDFRPTLYPAVVTLSRLWPRGLPIQCFQTANINTSKCSLPYLQARARQIVFMSPEDAMRKMPQGRNDVESSTAIGPFIDDYRHALKLYANLPDHTTTSEQQRIRSAWDHAVTQLNGDRMSEGEALGFWAREFDKAGVEVPAYIDQFPKRPPLTLPTSGDATQRMEWNPDPDPEQWIVQQRKLGPRALDWTLSTNGTAMNVCNVNSKVDVVEPVTVGRSAEPVWNVHSPASREGSIAAAVLYLDAKFGSESTLLSHPLPSMKDIRFPAIFLDDDFLERKDIHFKSALNIIQSNLSSIPTVMLVNLATSMKQRLGDAPKRDALTTTMRVVKMLSESDYPTAAMELVQYVVLDRPNDSSWHRHLLNQGYLNELPVQQARNLLVQISESIANKLRQQAERKPTEDQQEKSSAPFVKISTVKMVAQLMRGAEFVDQQFAVNVLSTLFGKVRHPDVKVAIIDSLIVTLASNTENHLKEAVFQFLEEKATPIAASLNERCPLSDNDWADAEAKCAPPEIQKDAPVFESLLSASTGITLKPADRETLVTRVIIPAVVASVNNHRRWVSIFATQCDFSPEDFPAIPKDSSILTELLSNHISILPRSFLDAYVALINLRLQPEQHVKEAMKDATSTNEQRRSNEGSHIKDIFNNFGGSGCVYIVGLLQQPFKPSKISDGIELSHVQEATRGFVQTLVNTGSFFELKGFLQQFEPPVRHRKDRYEAWQSNIRPVVEQLITWIDADLRTAEWQRSSNRKPEVLPDTFPMKMWLLTYPSSTKFPDHEARFAKFAGEIRETISNVSEAQAYHARLDQVKTAAKRIHKEHYARLAVAIGDLPSLDGNSLPTLACLLRIELADELLRAADNIKDQETTQKAKNMLAEWRVCEVESIRTKAVSTIMELSLTAHSWYSRKES